MAGVGPVPGDTTALGCEVLRLDPLVHWVEKARRQGRGQPSGGSPALGREMQLVLCRRGTRAGLIPTSKRSSVESQLSYFCQSNINLRVMCFPFFNF